MTPSQELQKLLGNLPNYSYEETLHLYSLATALQGGLLVRMHTFREQVAMPDIDHLLKVHEIADRLGTSEKWVRKNVASLPFHCQIGKLHRFSARGLDKWIDEQQAATMDAALPPERRQYAR